MDDVEVMARGIYGQRSRPYAFEEMRDEFLRDAQATLAALEASGRVVVPKEPTEAMFFAGNRAANPPIPNVRLIYRAMIEEASNAGK